MYLFSIEGGDGSGKGLATQIVYEVLQSEFCFKSVEVTAEPRSCLLYTSPSPRD